MTEQYWLRLPARLVGPIDRAKAEELLRDGHVVPDTPSCTDRAFQAAGQDPDAVQYVPLRELLSRGSGQTRQIAAGQTRRVQPAARTGQTRTIAKPGAGGKTTTRRVPAPANAETMAFEADVPAAPAGSGATIEDAPARRRIGKRPSSGHDYYFTDDEEDDIYDDPADEAPPMSTDQLRFSSDDPNANSGDPTNASHGQHGTTVRTATAGELPTPREPVSAKTIVTYGLYGIGLIVLVIGIVLTFNIVSDLNQQTDDAGRGNGAGLALNPAGSGGAGHGNGAGDTNAASNATPGNNAANGNANPGTNNGRNGNDGAPNNAGSNNTASNAANTAANNTAGTNANDAANHAAANAANNAANSAGNAANNAANNDPLAQRRAQDIARAIADIEAAFDQSLPGAARSRLGLLRQLDPDHPRLAWYSALSAYGHELQVEANAESLALVTADPTDLEAWTLRAMVLAYRFDAEGVRDVLAAVEPLDHDAAIAIAGIAMVHMWERHTALPFLEATLPRLPDADGWPDVLREQALICAFEAGVATLHEGLLRRVSDQLERGAFNTLAAAVLAGAIAFSKSPIDTDGASRAVGSLRGIGTAVPTGRIWRHAPLLASRVPGRGIEIVARWEAFRGSVTNFGVAYQRAAAVSIALFDAFADARVWLEASQIRQLFQLAQLNYLNAERAGIETRTAALAVRYFDSIPIFTREPEQMLERALGSDPPNYRLIIRSCGRTAHNDDAPAARRTIEPLVEALAAPYPYVAPLDEQIAWLVANPYTGALRAEAYMTLAEIHLYASDERDARRALDVVYTELLGMPYRTGLLRRALDLSVSIEGARKTADRADDLLERMDEFAIAPSRSRSDLLRVNLLATAQQKKFTQGERLIRDTTEAYSNCWFGGALMHELHALSALLAVEDSEFEDAEAALDEMGNAGFRRADAIADTVRLALYINRQDVHEVRVLTRGFSTKYQLDGDRTLFESWMHLVAGTITDAQFVLYAPPFTGEEAIKYLQFLAAGIRVLSVNRIDDFHKHVVSALETSQSDAPILYNFLKEYADEQDLD